MKRFDPVYRNMNTDTYNNELTTHLGILKALQYPSGLFAASHPEEDTGYDKSWLRDNFYECLAFEVTNRWDTVERTYSALLRVFLKHEEKIDWAIANKPQHRYQYIHARIDPETFDEFWEEWGNKQNDAVGAILFKVGELEAHRPNSILKTESHYRIVQKLVNYLSSIKYWKDADSGMWEENEEVHASSVGACVAGLKAVKKITGIKVNPKLISKGRRTLRALLPRESKEKFVDLAQLSLIWPYNIVSDKQAAEILKNVEYHLVKKRGVIRYKGDYYYNKDEDAFSQEAEWTMGFAWLSIIYEKRGNLAKAKDYLKKMQATVSQRGFPELYYSNSPVANENNPLGWAQSLYVVALHNLHGTQVNDEERAVQYGINPRDTSMTA